MGNEFGIFVNKITDFINYTLNGSDDTRRIVLRVENEQVPVDLDLPQRDTEVLAE